MFLFAVTKAAAQSSTRATATGMLLSFAVRAALAHSGTHVNFQPPPNSLGAAVTPVEFSTRQLHVWKTIKLGTVRSVIELREALDSLDCGNAVLAVLHTSMQQGCHLGNSANEAVGRREFTISSEPKVVGLVRTTVFGLGFSAAEMQTIGTIYRKAEEAGLAVCPAEVGPQLRLQYLDQPLGEFLVIATPPMSDYAGEPLLFLLGNGGAGLLLVARIGGLGTKVPNETEFVFCVPQERRHD